MSIEQQSAKQNDILESSEAIDDNKADTLDQSIQRKNLIELASESAHKTLDLNRRLKGFEQAIHSLENKLSNARKSFHQSTLDLGQRTTGIKEEHSKTIHQIQQIESSFRHVQTQSEQFLTKINLLSDKLINLTENQTQSTQIIDNKLLSAENQNKKVTQHINEEIELLKSTYQNIENKTNDLLNNSNTLSQSLQQKNIEQDEKISQLKSNTNNKFLNLENTLTQLDKKQIQNIEQVSAILEEKEKKIQSDYQSKISQLDGKHEQLEHKYNQLEQSHNNDIENLQQQQQRFENQSHILIEQTELKFGQNIEELENEQNELVDNLAIYIEQSKQAVNAKIDVLENSSQDIRIQVNSQNKEINEIKNDFDSFESLFNQNQESTQGQLDQIKVNNKLAHQEITQLNTNRKNHQSSIDELLSSIGALSNNSDSHAESIEKLQKKTKAHDAQHLNLASQIDGVADEQAQIKDNFVQSETKTERSFHIHRIAMAFVVLMVAISAFYYTKTNNEKDLAIQQSLTQQSMSSLKQNKKQMDIEKKFQNHETELSNNRIISGEVAATVKSLREQLQQYQYENKNLKRQVSQLAEAQALIDDNVYYLNKTRGALSEYQYGKINSSHWLAQQPPFNLTIVLGTYNSKLELFKFVEDEGYFLKEKLAYSSKTVQGKEQFMLLYGSFSNETDAKQAIYELPYSLGTREKSIIKLKTFQTENWVGQLD
ncbi:MAG: hypothetical protein HQL46_13615 [Gammaproteobacteria bacterium]|nr:hypothetical protein [Gammaproteobacteria bacterium]